MQNDLADRMKTYEASTKLMLPKKSFYVLRVDGHNFSRYTKDLEAPFDQQFADDMDATTRELCREVSGTILAFTQSDEISLIFSDLAKDKTQAYQGGSVNKITSLLAALSSTVFNERRPGRRALFDARVSTLPSAVEVVNYLIWRQRDAVRNSVSMAAQTLFSAQELYKLNTLEVKQKLEEAGLNWQDYPQGFRQGRVSVKVANPQEVQFFNPATQSLERRLAQRSDWQTLPAPIFKVNEDDQLMNLLNSYGRDPFSSPKFE